MRKWYALTTALILTIDRLVKAWATVYLKTQPGYTVPLIRNVFHFTYLENTGASFGMLEGQYALFYVLTTVAALVLIWMLFIRPVKSGAMGIALALVLGGTLGNFYDRVFYRYVVDMFDFRLINFAVFNVADSALCVGVGLVVLFTIFEERKALKRAGATASQPEEKADDTPDNA